MARGLADRRERRADRVGDAEHVRQDHRAPVLGRLLEEAARGAEAGVGEDDVDAAEARRARRCDQRSCPPTR